MHNHPNCFLFDAHCHLDDPRLSLDLEQVLERARAQGVRGFVTAGVSPATWPIQDRLARMYRYIFVTYGLHPWIVAEGNRVQVVSWLQQLEDVLQSDAWVSPVGLGEIGLDHSSRFSEESRDMQTFAFREQLALARNWNLPVVLHVVRAHEQTLDILRNDGLPNRGGMVHGFSGSPEMARAYVQLGLYISFGGAITRPQAKKVRRAAAQVDESRLLCETDAPDMTPYPDIHERNEPMRLWEVIQEVAHLRNMSITEVAAMTTRNTQTLFVCEV